MPKTHKRHYVYAPVQVGLWWNRKYRCFLLNKAGEADEKATRQDKRKLNAT